MQIDLKKNGVRIIRFSQNSDVFQWAHGCIFVLLQRLSEKYVCVSNYSTELSRQQARLLE